LFRRCASYSSILVSFFIVLIAICPAAAQVSVTTERYDNGRTGANLGETVLNTTNVNVSQFGKLYSYTIDGSVQAQPLYVPNLTVSGQGTHNVLFVVTMNDVIYALDADKNTPNNGILWSVDLRNPVAGVTAIPISDIVGQNNLNIVGNVGVESTPVIDLNTNTMYLVARTKEVAGSTTSYVARLHAFDITSGSEKFGGPTIIRGSVPGTGVGSSGGTLTFDPKIQNQRSSLAMANGSIIFSFASHEDLFSWHGWVMAYNAQTLQQTSIFCSTPNGLDGGMWMAGRAPVIDSNGNAYYATGNGDWNGTGEYGDSILKLNTTGGGISVADYFTPDNYQSLQDTDRDLGSSGPLLVPGTDLLIHAGKESVFYLMHLSNLGKEQAGNNQIVQHFATLNGADIRGGPVFWQRTTGAGPTMYIWPDLVPVQAYHFNGTNFDTSPISQGSIVAPTGNSGGVLTLSANGSTPGTGIVWSSMPLSQDGDHGLSSGVLRAFDANNLQSELWDSTMNSSRDDMGIWPKYSPPTVVNGKVYMASFSSLLNVYGVLNAAPDFTLSAAPPTQSVVIGGNTAYTVNIGAVNGYSSAVSLSVSGQPAGTTVSFNPTAINPGSTSVLTVTTSSSTPPGTFTLTITGISGSLTHIFTISLQVAGAPDFTLSATPTAATVGAGGSANYTVNTAALNGFSGALSLSASGLPSGATATFSPASINPGATSTLIVATAGSTPTGTSTVTITGTSGTLTHAATVNLTVTGTGGSSGTSIGIHFVGNGTSMAASETAGVIAKSNWNNETGAKSTAAMPLVDENGAASPATVTWSADNTWALPIADQAGNVRMMEGYLDSGSGNTTTVTVSGLPVNSTGYNVYVYADGDNNTATRTGIYQISGTGISTTSISLTDAASTNFSGTFTQANNSNGNYAVFTVNATSFTISAIPSTASDGTQRAPVNAIQMVPAGPAAPDFGLTATPASASVTLGGSATYTVSAGALNSFSGSVNLSISGLPTGATASFIPAAISGGTSSTLTVTTAANTPTGGSSLTVTGISGGLTHTIAVMLVVNGTPDFSITAAPATATINPGSNAIYTTTVGALNSFSGSVGLSVSGLPIGASAAFNPTTLSGSGNSTLTVTTASNTLAGSSTLTITGTSGALTHTATVTLAVNASGGSATKAISIKFVGNGPAMGASETAGVIAKSNWNEASNASSTSPLGLVDETGSATTATVTWQSDNTWVLPITDQAGNVRMMEGYLDNGNGNTTIVTVSGLPANSTGYNVYVYADGDNKINNRTGVYQISGTGITATSISLTDAANSNFSGTFLQANNSNGNYVMFTINATGFTLSAIPGVASDGIQRAPVNGIQIIPVGAPTADFALGITPASASATQGGSATYTVTAAAQNGFGGTVALSASGLPTGATATFSPSSVAAGASSTMTVTTVANTPTGSSTLTATGTSGALTHTTTATLVVNGAADFSFTVTPSSTSVTQGSSATYSATVAALNGFSSAVTLSASGLPTGATATFNPSSLNGSGNSVLTITTTASTPTGSAALTITGASGALTHSTSVTLNVTSAGSGVAKSISIDFVGSGTAIAASETAGVVAKANWNNASLASRSTPLGLVDETGSATTASVTWRADGTWLLPIVDQVGNFRMMRGYLDNGSGGTSTVTVSGLPANTNGYTVYVYADGDNKTSSRAGVYQISGAGITTTSVTLTDAPNTNFSGTFKQANNSAGNFVVFTITTTGFTLGAIPSTASDGSQRAPLNGIQIVPR